MNIYTLSNEVEQAMNNYYSCFDEDTGELIVDDNILEFAKQELELLQNQKNDIFEWKLKDRQNKLGHNSSIDEEITRLNKLKNQNSKKIERIEKELDYNFREGYNGKPTVLGNFTIKYTKSSSVSIDEENIPEKFKVREMKEIIKIPKADIKKAIQNGETVEGAEIVEKLTLKIV